MTKAIITKSSYQTQKFAANFSRLILKSPAFAKATAGKRHAVIIGLIGELGSGKTTFTQGFAKGLGVKKIITSPTFVLEKIYELTGKKHLHFVHIDAYRIEKSEEVLNLGFKNLIRDSKNIILIEWADRIKKILPRDCIRIKFDYKGKDKRKITIKNVG